MKKLWLSLLLLLLWISPLSAQLSQTPNLGLYIIPFGYQQWHIPVNDNTVIVDTELPKLNLDCQDDQLPVWSGGKFSICGYSLVTPARVTNAGKPAVPKPNQVVVVTDALNGLTCTSGGGTTNNICQWTGTNWLVIGTAGGGGGGGGFDAITGGTNTTAAMVVGTGASLSTSGSGIITATSAVTLAANGANCPAGQAARGVDASGIAEDCFVTGHDIQDEGAAVAKEPILDFTGAGVTVTPGVGKTIVNVPGGAGTTFTTVGTGVNTSSIMTCGTGCQMLTSGTGTITPHYVPSGSIAATTVQGAIAELDAEKQPLDADLTALAANATAGFWAASTNVVRSMATASVNNITIANPTGAAGNPTWDVGPNVALTTRSFTPTTGDFDFTNATSFTFPRATGAAPTASGRCAYDNTTNTMKCGMNGVTLTLATTNLFQPLHANLTALAGLVGINGKIPYFTGAGAMALTSGLETPCADTGGQHLNLSAVGTFVCGTSSSGGLTGGTTGTLLKYASATTATNSIITESGGTATVGGNLVVGTGPYLIFDTSAISGADETWVVQNVGGTILPAAAAGTFSNGNILKASVTAGLVTIVDGGAAGTGTWTDSSTNTGTNKTLVDEAASAATTGNSIVIGIAPYWDAASLTLPSTSTCTLGTIAAINSGPSTYPLTCTDATTSTFEGQIALRQAVGTVTFTLTVNDVDSSSHHFAGSFSAMCRGNGTTVNATWGTAQTVDITMVSANVNYTATTAAVTPNGTCGADSVLFWRFVVDTTPHTDDSDARVIGILMKQAS